MTLTQVNLRLPAEMVAEIDRDRGLIPRNVWLLDAAQRKLGSDLERPPSEAKEPTSQEQADPGSVPSSEGVRSAAAVRGPRGREDLYERGARVRAGAVTRRTSPRPAKKRGLQ